MEERRTCRRCGRPIPAGRVKALPGVDTCVDHSDARPITEDTQGVVDGPDERDLVRSAQTSERSR